MRGTLLVGWREFWQQIRSRAFILSTIGLPVMLMGIWAISGSLSGRAQSTSLVEELAKAERPNSVVGYVDRSGLIQSMPPGIPEGIFVAFPDQDAASAAMNEGRISAYYVLPPNYTNTGEATRISPQLPLAPVDRIFFEWVLAWNIVPGQSLQETARLREPFDPQGLQFVPVGIRSDREESRSGSSFAPFLVILTIMMPLFMAGGYLLQGLGQEKENRVIEVLLISLRPWQLLAGKLIGLGTLTVVQFGVWLLVASLMLGATVGGTGDIVNTVDLSGAGPAVIAAFAIGGFLLYATLMAGLGAVAPNLEATRMWSFFITAPMMLPLILWASIASFPNGLLAVALSILPFSAPVGMLLRIVSTNVPTWQIALSLILVFVTSVLMLALTARLFRASTLLNGQPISPRRVWKAVWEG